jgi:predicted lipid-binding transport protein (Tim44 family)
MAYLSRRAAAHIAAVLSAVVLALACLPADAKRLGGGKRALGQQSTAVSQGAKPQPAQAPAQRSDAGQASQQGTASQAAPAQGTTAAASKAPAGPVAAAQARSPMSGMLMGLAAGLGLAALASYLGFGEALAQIMTIVLLGLVLLVALAWALRRFGPSRGLQPEMASPGGSPHMSRGGVAVGTSPRPLWPHQGEAHQGEVSGGSQASRTPASAFIGSVATPAPAMERFDEAQFVAAAKRGFVGLQAAWDSADHGAMRQLMTDKLLADIKEQLAARSVQPNRTDVVTLDARFLGLDVVDGFELASVEFTGMIREDEGAAAMPFREIWNMTRPLDGSQGWLVAGIQPLQ